MIQDSNLNFSCASHRMSAIGMLLPLLLIVLCISSTEAFLPLSVPDNAHVQSSSINDRRSLHVPYKRTSQLRTIANDPWKHQQRNVLSIHSPALLQLAKDDNNHVSIVKDEEQKSLFRRILTFPIRVFRKPLRFLRRKNDESEKESHEEDAAAADIDHAPTEDSSISDDSKATVDQADTESPALQIDELSEIEPHAETVTEEPSVSDGPTTIEGETIKPETETPSVQEDDESKHSSSTAKEQVVVSTSTDRSPTCAKSVDLSGQWDLLVTDEFKDEYDNYLTLLGQPFLVRSVAMSIVAMTTEETKQTDNGRSLFILGRNLRGIWERELVTTDKDSSKPFVPLQTEIITADGEAVIAEAWWEDEGRTHRSWLRGVKKYGGGDFESRRYLADNGDTLICESTFHPTDPKRQKAKVTWRFTRQKEGDGDKQA